MKDDLSLLMAEDNEINRKLAGLLFKKLGLGLDFASNGQEAVEMVKANPYDLVFMDIEMPVLTGIQATESINESLADKAPPIVALTAHTMQGDRERFIEAGMTDYLTKPINVQELKTILEKYGS